MALVAARRWRQELPSVIDVLCWKLGGKVKEVMLVETHHRSRPESELVAIHPCRHPPNNIVLDCHKIIRVLEVVRHILLHISIHRLQIRPCGRHPTTPSTTTTTMQRTAVVLPHVLRLVDGAPWDLLVANLSWDETFTSTMKVRKRHRRKMGRSLCRPLLGSFTFLSCF